VKFLFVTAVSWLVGLGLFLSLLLPLGPALATAASYIGVIVATAMFHARYVRTQREFLADRHPWLDFWVSSLLESAACAVCAVYLASRIDDRRVWEIFFISFALAMLVRYILRKELLLDIRGLRAASRG
jgi:hypothetical protein